MADARTLFKAFHDREPTARELAILKQKAPEETLEVGTLYGLMYKVREERKPYLHMFGPSARPLVFVNGSGRQVYIVGGKYRFTDRGFIG